MLEGLIGSSQRLEGLLRQEGNAAGAEAFFRCVEPARQKAELRDLRQRIFGELKACADHNRTNSEVLERKRAALERALRILLAQDESPDRYRATGKLENFGRQHSIGRA